MKRLLLIAALVPFFAGSPVEASSSFRTEYLTGLDDIGRKLVDLSESIPAEKYSWRPGTDVRSISEVFTHVAGSNYFLLTFVGEQPPADLPLEIEKVTEKARVVAELKRSLEFLRASASTITDEDAEKPVKLFGKTTTQRAVYITILNHLHEHLGQSIAYARMNGVTPPWSR